jgi:hypothetical protein
LAGRTVIFYLFRASRISLKSPEKGLSNGIGLIFIFNYLINAIKNAVKIYLAGSDQSERMLGGGCNWWVRWGWVGWGWEVLG